MEQAEIVKIKFRIWAMSQDNLRRGENIDKCRDDNYRKTLEKVYAATAREIDELREMLKHTTA